MDETLYETPSTGNFLMHFSIVNETDGTIYVDLRDYWQTIRPIQYAGGEMPEMTVIDITSQIPPELTDSLREELTSAADNGSLLTVGSYGQLDYYVDFNAAGRAEIDALGVPWLMVAAGGWLNVTDGDTVEQLGPEQGFVYLALPQPVSWLDVPTGSIIAFDSPQGPRIKRIGASGI
jgi:hypothetical protein